MSRHFTNTSAARLTASVAAALTLAAGVAAPASAHQRGDRHHHRHGAAAKKARLAVSGDKRRDTLNGHRGLAGGATGRKIG